MKNYKILLFAFFTFLAFTSCSVDDDPGTGPEIQGEYTNGIFVLNEGNFGSGNTTVSFIEEDLQTVRHNIFALENSGASLGDTGQDIGFYEDLAFIVLNVSNKIEVVDRYTFESIATIDTELDNPRFIAFTNGKAYVSNWGDGSDPNDDFIAVIDTESFNVEEVIRMAEGPEAIVAEGSRVYVAHKGGWSINNKVSVINTSDLTVEEILTVGYLPNSLQVADGYLWVASSGRSAYPDPAEESAGSIHKIDLMTFETVQEYHFENATDHPGDLVIDNNMVYYTLNAEVYKMGTDATTLPEAGFLQLDEVPYLYGFTVKDGLIYAASASPDFTSNGELFIYNTSTGALETTFETGVNPNGIFFQN